MGAYWVAWSSKLAVSLRPEVCLAPLLNCLFWTGLCEVCCLDFRFSAAYITHEDICRCFDDDTMLAIQAPSGTQLEVPIPDGVSIFILSFSVTWFSCERGTYVSVHTGDPNTNLQHFNDFVLFEFCLLSIFNSQNFTKLPTLAIVQLSCWQICHCNWLFEDLHWLIKEDFLLLFVIVSGSHERWVELQRGIGPYNFDANVEQLVLEVCLCLVLLSLTTFSTPSFL